MNGEDIPARITKRVVYDLLRHEREQRVLRRHESDVEVFEEVFDKPTLLTLYDLMNARVLAYLNGVVASGKESRVYWGVREDGSSVAVKIYLVASAEFRHRMQYIVGDPRFRSVKKGIRNVVKLWARKEFRNLDQAQRAGVPVPEPHEVKGNVLVMEFIGRDGVPAPTLNECEVSKKHYTQVLEGVSRLYEAGLVHADLSEYNIFLHEGRIVIFDIGSAVDISHPNAGRFLIRDITNINRFFAKHGVSVYDVNRIVRMVKRR